MFSQPLDLGTLGSGPMGLRELPPGWFGTVCKVLALWGAALGSGVPPTPKRGRGPYFRMMQEDSVCFPARLNVLDLDPIFRRHIHSEFNRPKCPSKPGVGVPPTPPTALSPHCPSTRS